MIRSFQKTSQIITNHLNTPKLRSFNSPTQIDQSAASVDRMFHLVFANYLRLREEFAAHAPVLVLLCKRLRALDCNSSPVDLTLRLLSRFAKRNSLTFADELVCLASSLLDACPCPPSDPPSPCFRTPPNRIRSYHLTCMYTLQHLPA